MLISETVICDMLPGRLPRLPERPPPSSPLPRGTGRTRTYRSRAADSRSRPDRRRSVRGDLRPPPRRQRPATPPPGRPRGGPWRELEARDPGASLSLFARPPRVDRLPRLQGSVPARPCEVPPFSAAERPPQEVRSSGLKPNQTHDPTTIHRDTPPCPCPKHGPCSPSRSANGALATVVHMVDAGFIPAGGVPANKITSPCH